ncbi:MAG: hypothetical protein H6656_10225 [Ardenticatenaceae bacterium]|nr:hypothetical protein [Ardenticatenaceae bacterium]
MRRAVFSILLMLDVIDGQNTLLILGSWPSSLHMWHFAQLYAPRAGRAARIAMRLCSGGILVAGTYQFRLSITQFCRKLVGPCSLGCLLVSGLIWLGILNLRQPSWTLRWLLLLWTG